LLKQKKFPMDLIHVHQWRKSVWKQCESKI
jgi:hypothetical protein